MRAVSDDTQVSSKALEALFQRYEPPIAAAIRRLLRNAPWIPDEPLDVIHDFFLAQFQPEALEDAIKTCHGVITRGGGKLKLRQYMSRRLDFFLKDKWRHWRVRVPPPPDPLTGKPPEEAKDFATGATLLDREWAIHLIRSGIEDVRQQFRTDGKEEEFRALEPSLRKEETARQWELASRLGLTEEALKAQLFRLRKAVREAIDERLAATLIDPTEADLDAEREELYRRLES